MHGRVQRAITLKRDIHSLLLSNSAKMFPEEMEDIEQANSDETRNRMLRTLHLGLDTVSESQTSLAKLYPWISHCCCRNHLSHMHNMF